MIGNECFLDTSVIVHSFKNKEEVVEKLVTFNRIYVSTIAIGELYYGAYASMDPPKHIAQIKLFLSSCIVIAIDAHTAAIYGEIKTELKKKGKPIPENDIWIAAASIANDLPLFTTDKHFNLLDNLALIPIN